MIKIKIVVCIKQVPGSTEIKINPDTNTLVREGVENAINPFDSYAIEEAIRVKERVGGNSEVLAVTMGPPQAEDILKDSISMGVDKAILLSDRAFAGADTWATSLVIAKTVNRIGDVSLIIFGKQTLDGDTGQVGPEFAQHMNIPFIGYVSQIIDIRKKTIKAKRLMEDRYETIEVGLPAAISVVKDINQPRIPSLRGKMKAKKEKIPIWGKDDIEAEEDEVGLMGSYTKVIKIFTPDIKHEVKILGGSIDEKVDQLFSELKELNVV
ncbi:MAG: electron transfer flavoprotein subunit beta/FixA family protein [Candidatus Humimicrobiaceae bacterium]